MRHGRVRSRSGTRLVWLSQAATSWSTYSTQAQDLGVGRWCVPQLVAVANRGATLRSVPCTPCPRRPYRHAGLTVEQVDERPGEPAMWERLYQLWTSHAGKLRREPGEAPAQSMLREAARRPGGAPASGERTPQ
ncbi:hypothetical protein [Streptomyces fradiae]|uniref:hypothetical protein n=1 Tax=Streptomyces fradiae TaxID=1906 RepID=UPI0036A95F9B